MIDFWPEDFFDDWDFWSYTSNDKLLSIIPEKEWDLIERAGILAFQCRAYDAESVRKLAGYGELDSDPGATKYDSERVQSDFQKYLEQDE